MAEQWILDLTKELECPPPAAKQKLNNKSIYRVPKILKDVNSQAYEPKLASFGPYHHDCRHLRPMERHKHRALLNFLGRIYRSPSAKTPEDVLIAMKNVEERLLDAYDALEADDDAAANDVHHHAGPSPSPRRRREWLKEKDEFLKLMIVDGCFSLEVMLAAKRSAASDLGDYDAHDPVFGAERKNYVIPDLKRDMLLIENQLPLLALSTLASIPGSGIGDVNDLIKSFYNTAPAASAVPEDDGLNKSFHVLDLYRKVMTKEGKYLPSYEDNVQSATELRDAGVSFCRSDSRSFRDIEFRGGVLSLPALEIDDTTEALLLNLMAFERLHATAENEVTAYAFFMDGLINTSDDVALLRTEDIITGWVGCDGNIASMFNRIIKEATLVVFKDDIKVDVNLKLNNYCKKRMHKWRASFMQTYLKNPWVFTSLLCGLLLLGLTIVQTVYTIMPYYNA